MGFTDTEQEWSSDFGNSYLKRNRFTVRELDDLYIRNYGISRSQMNTEFLGNLDRSCKILEIGCNIGNQLKLLQSLGFKNLWGLDILEEAVETAKKNTKGINIIKSSAFDIPFKNRYFDLVYTSGVLIHINPNNLNNVLESIYSLSSRYIWCFEYYNEVNVDLEYRGKKGLLWKNNFLKLFMEKYSDLKLLKEMKVKYLDRDNTDSMFLIEKVK
ncbi:MAG: methyltransferase domain-containing protein [Candidatus Nitrosocosmicus sp.]|nr:methyltransferase domain-containing protein [Candidatus Nitrosocosmicus sp.]